MTELKIPDNFKISPEGFKVTVDGGVITFWLNPKTSIGMGPDVWYPAYTIPVSVFVHNVTNEAHRFWDNVKKWCHLGG